MSWIFTEGECDNCCGTVMVCGSHKPDCDYYFACTNEGCENHEGSHVGGLDIPDWVKQYTKEKHE